MLATAALIACLSATQAALGDAPVTEIPAARQAHHLRAVDRPTNVPPAYVLTHHGWFDPSCVININSDETVGSDLVVRDQAGATRLTIAPCAHPRFNRRGQTVAPVEPEPVSTGEDLAAPPQAAAIYDGYIVYYTFNGNLAVGPSISTDWVVPPAPTNVADQDIAFFNDILTSAGGGDILQPVLDFNGEVQGKWAIESEHCCLSGNDMQTTPVTVAPGDVIRGLVTGTGCVSTGICQAWTVTTTDVTSGKSTTLNTTAPMGVPNGVSPGALETYGVSSCDMFPSGTGATIFSNHTVNDANGSAQSLRYSLLTLSGVAAEVPRNCGYGGTTSGSSFTLIYGMGGADGGSPGGSARDGGATDASGVSDGRAADGRVADGGRILDASVDVGGHAGSTGNGGGPMGDGARDALAASDGAGGQGGGSGTGGQTNIGGGAGSLGTGGQAVPDAAAPTEAGENGTDDMVSGGTGCSCSTAPGTDGAPWLALVGSALIGTVVRRRRARIAGKHR